MSSTYGQSISWTNDSGGKTTVHIRGRETYELAMADAIREAEALGWTPKKWYQLWRIGDTVLIPDGSNPTS